MSEFENIKISRIIELLNAEAIGSFDQREATPHKFLISIINSENSNRLTSYFIDILNAYQGSSGQNTILAPLSRVLSGAHVIELFDRKRIYRTLIDLSSATDLSALEKSAVLDCINALRVPIERSDLVLMEGIAEAEYPFQWCVSLIRSGEYRELEQFLNEIMTSSTTSLAEIRRFFPYLYREVPEDCRSLFSTILKEFNQNAREEENEETQSTLFPPPVTSQVIVLPLEKDRSAWLDG